MHVRIVQVVCFTAQQCPKHHEQIHSSHEARTHTYTNIYPPPIPDADEEEEEEDEVATGWSGGICRGRDVGTGCVEPSGRSTVGTAIGDVNTGAPEAEYASDRVRKKPGETKIREEGEPNRNMFAWGAVRKRTTPVLLAQLAASADSAAGGTGTPAAAARPLFMSEGTRVVGGGACGIGARSKAVNVSPMMAAATTLACFTHTTPGRPKNTPHTPHQKLNFFSLPHVSPLTIDVKHVTEVKSVTTRQTELGCVGSMEKTSYLFQTDLFFPVHGAHKRPSMASARYQTRFSERTIGIGRGPAYTTPFASAWGKRSGAGRDRHFFTFRHQSRFHSAAHSKLGTFEKRKLVFCFSSE